jgi:very-short-patch-repair endonuclease
MSKGVCRSSPRIGDQIDTPSDVLVAAWAATQHGLISVEQLHACGLGRNAIALRVRNGRLHRVHRGVYAVGHPALTLTGRFVAAVLACGDDSSLSFFSSGAYWSFMRWEERLIDVTVVGTTTRGIAGVRVHRARSLDPRDVWHRDGMRVTSPARTLLDLAAVLPPEALRRAARQAQAERRVNIHQLREILARSNGHRGVAALRAIVDDGPTPTRSDLEDALLDLLDDAGIERPEVNAPLRLDGRRIVPDYLWRARRITIEADSRRWHDDPLTRRNDSDKQAILEANDYRVLRITDRQITDHPQQTLTRVRAALAAGA